VLFKRRQKPKTRVLVIGLDGVPHSMLARLAADRVMPATASILRSGHLMPMTVSLPEISAVSWSTFMTGVNPGTHGIFGFTDLKRDSYDIRFPSFRDLEAPTFWDRLGETGKRCVVINQPATYPAREINGALVSGFVAIDLRKAVYPAKHIAALEAMGYRIDVDVTKPEALFDDLGATLAARERAVEYLWDAEEWDYLQVVITGTDRLHHLFWDAWQQHDHPRRAAFLDYYRAVDGLVGRLRDRFLKLTGGLEDLYLLSDHGFTGITQEVYLNTWLRQQRYLDYDKQAPESVADISAETVAFALDPGRIYINTRGRFPRGTVDPAQAPELKAELRAGLKQMTYQGQPVIRQVFDGAEVYDGPLAEKGPDLVLLSHPGFDLKGSVRHPDLFGRTHFQGMHTWDDAFFWSAAPVSKDLGCAPRGSRVTPEGHIDIADLAAIITAPLV